MNCFTTLTYLTITYIAFISIFVQSCECTGSREERGVGDWFSGLWPWGKKEETTTTTTTVVTTVAKAAATTVETTKKMAPTTASPVTITTTMNVTESQRMDTTTLPVERTTATTVEEIPVRNSTAAYPSVVREDKTNNTTTVSTNVVKADEVAYTTVGNASAITEVTIGVNETNAAVTTESATGNTKTRTDLLEKLDRATLNVNEKNYRFHTTPSAKNHASLSSAGVLSPSFLKLGLTLSIVSYFQKIQIE